MSDELDPVTELNEKYAKAVEEIRKLRASNYVMGHVLEDKDRYIKRLETILDKLQNSWLFKHGDAVIEADAEDLRKLNRKIETHENTIRRQAGFIESLKEAIDCQGKQLEAIKKIVNGENIRNATKNL